MSEVARPLTQQACILRAAFMPSKSQSTTAQLNNGMAIASISPPLDTAVLACTLKALKRWPASNMPLVIK